MAEHPFTIHHSGRSFTSLGYDGRYFVWPIEEYLVRTKHSPAVRERIARLNPNGKSEGEWPRGWHPSPRNWQYDAVGPKEFVRRFGREAYRKVPRNVIHHDGHRKLIPSTYVVESGLRSHG